MKKIICILLLLLAMSSMYYFSSQDGVTSSQQSQIAVKIIDKIRDKVTLKDERLITIKDKIYNELKAYDKQYIIRKAAHFLIYASIGAFMMLVLYLFSKRISLSANIAFILTILYAIYDENRQLSINGRSGNIIDVFIDSSGALLAIATLSIILATGKGIGFIFNLNKKTDED